MERIDINLPSGWSELSQPQLRNLFQAMVDSKRDAENRRYLSLEDYTEQEIAQVRARCFLCWSGLKLLTPYGSGWLLSDGKREFMLPLSTISAAADSLAWVAELPPMPVRLEQIDGAAAAVADISEGFSFDKWLSCETFYQAYNVSQDVSLLQKMAEVLYDKHGISLMNYEALSVFYWWASLKSMLSAIFPNFLVQASDPGGEPVSPDTLRRSMDAQIRALTKGDITKEQQILSLEAWRALTELDALAREYEELNRKYKK